MKTQLSKEKTGQRIPTRTERLTYFTWFNYGREKQFQIIEDFISQNTRQLVIKLSPSVLLLLESA